MRGGAPLGPAWQCKVISLPLNRVGETSEKIDVHSDVALRLAWQSGAMHGYPMQCVLISA